MGVLELQQRIRRRMRRGDSLHDVEDQIIDPAHLDPDQKAVLWLYAWSLVPIREQRAEVTRLTELLVSRR